MFTFRVCAEAAPEPLPPFADDHGFPPAEAARPPPAANSGGRQMAILASRRLGGLGKASVPFWKARHGHAQRLTHILFL